MRDAPDDTQPSTLTDRALPNLIGPLVLSFVGGGVVAGALVASGVGLTIAALSYPVSGSLILFVAASTRLAIKAAARRIASRPRGPGSCPLARSPA